MAIKPVLQQWPHLLKLFMQFLDPRDAVQAKAVSLRFLRTFKNPRLMQVADKIDFEQVKSFSKSLQVRNVLYLQFFEQVFIRINMETVHYS